MRKFFIRVSDYFPLGRLFPTLDWSIFILPILLNLFGIAVLFSFQSKGSIALSQVIFAVIGLAIMMAAAFFDYRNFRPASWYLYAITIVLLVVVRLIGESVFGARRWIDLGIFQLQPSELVKIAEILVIGSILSGSERGRLGVKQLGVLFGFILMPVVLTLKQPDLGTASVLVVIALGTLIHSKLSKRFWLVFLIVVLAAAPLVYHRLAPYQRERLATFIDPKADPSGAGYNIIQSVITVGSGGIWGRGLGQGSQSQLQFLPVAHTDFIFAGISEALGFAGSATLVLIFMTLVWRAINTSMIAQDNFGQAVALGIAVMWFYQGLVNIGMNLGLFPVTGLPLPFVSSGGTAMIVNYLAIGILQSIYIRHKKIRFG